MNETQKKLYIANVDLAEVLAMNATCVEAEYDELLREAERVLAKAVMQYDDEKHGDFEKYATPLIKSALNRVVNSNVNAMFTVKTKREREEKIEFSIDY